MTLVGQLVTNPRALHPLRSEWDALAVASRRPYCSPAWMLAWWENAAPPAAALRVVGAFEGDTLVGIAPFWLEPARLGRARCRMLAAGTAARLEPLARPGLEVEAAAAFAAVLKGASPQPGSVSFEELPPGSPWPRLLAQAWGLHPDQAIHRGDRIPAPAAALAANSLDDWLASKSGNFRQQVRRARRQLDAAGARFRLSTEESVGEDLQTMARLHYERWSERGGSDALDASKEDMLEAVARELLPSGRFRLWCLDVEGETVSVHAFLAAGGELSYWLGGFDERYASQKPGLITLVVALGDALSREEDRMDLGPGGQDYKYRLADSEEQLERVDLVLPGSSATLVRARLLAKAALRRLPDSVAKPARRLMRR